MNKPIFLLLLITTASTLYAQKRPTHTSYKRQLNHSAVLASSAPKMRATVPRSLTDVAQVDQSAPVTTPTTLIPVPPNGIGEPTTDRNLALPEMAAPTAQTIRSYPVELAFNKTVSIIFPAPVRSVDLGSRDIIADKAADVENVLKVKANQIGFNETNFSVITADGKFYSFVVSYNESPVALALNLAATGQPITSTTQNIGSGSVHFAGAAASQSEMAVASDRILHKARRLLRIGATGSKMAVKLKGLYVKDNVLYYRLAFRNRSNLNYDLDFVRFFIVDKTIAKEASHQEIEVRPIYVHNDPIRTVKGHSQVEKVFAFQSFTLPADKVLQIQTGEQNGGRQLAFSVYNRVVMKARPL
ncbi:conjugative transposon protein TraN [Spirosoma sordidisoli]|uniref:Conjugative transposon protein TraN n=1 Tax=Spirosoma sordidisoli TaxID=2502893 RepID=A0A4Q2UCJ7_9BACT|nr:conjugative transposon protein TraN [Spirosoma sordidisoli]